MRRLVAAVSSAALISGGLAMATAGAANAATHHPVVRAAHFRAGSHIKAAWAHPRLSTKADRATLRASAKKLAAAKAQAKSKTIKSNAVLTNPVCGQPIGPNTTVVLTRPMNCLTGAAMIITGSHVTVNLNGQTINGFGVNTSDAIAAPDDVNNLVITGGQSSTGKALGGTITGFYGDAVALEYGTTNFTIKYLNTVSNALADGGIYAPDSESAHLLNNNITGGAYGIYMPGSAENSIAWNRISSSSVTGLFLVGDHLGLNKVYDNYFSGAQEDMVVGWQENDFIAQNALPGSALGAVLLGLDGTSTVVNNTANRDGIGFLVADSGNSSSDGTPLTLAHNYTNTDFVGFQDGTDCLYYPFNPQDLSSLVTVIDALGGDQFDLTDVHPPVADVYTNDGSANDLWAAFELTQTSTSVVNTAISITQGEETNPAGTGPVGVWLNNDTGSFIAGLRITGDAPFDGVGILMNDSSYDVVGTTSMPNSVSVPGTYSDGIMVQSVAEDTNNWIQDNVLNGNGYDGLDVQPSDVSGLVTINNNQASNNGNLGFDVECALTVVQSAGGNFGEGNLAGTYGDVLDPSAAGLVSELLQNL
jgi:parallel beta-helix repeat protein